MRMFFCLIVLCIVSSCSHQKGYLKVNNSLPLGGYSKIALTPMNGPKDVAPYATELVGSMFRSQKLFEIVEFNQPLPVKEPTKSLKGIQVDGVIIGTINSKVESSFWNFTGSELKCEVTLKLVESETSQIIVTASEDYEADSADAVGCIQTATQGATKRMLKHIVKLAWRSKVDSYGRNPASLDLVILKNGEVYTGDIIWGDKWTGVKIKLKSGEVKKIKATDIDELKDIG